MINRLRSKIVFINVVLMSIILLTALITVFAVGFSRMRKESEERLKSALELDFSDSGLSFSEDTTYEDIIVVILNEDNTLKGFYSHANKADLYDVVVNKAVELSLNGAKGGFLWNLRSTYRIADDADGGTRVVLMDVSASRNSLGAYSFISLLIALVSLASYFIISYLLAHIALKPVEDSWQQQKQFVADASHELKTPLSVIMANTEIIASHPDETVKSQMKWIENTRSESNRMAELVANLLFLAKNDDGLKIQLSEVNLSECINNTVLSYDAVLYENGKTFEYDITDGIKVLGNEGQLKQLVTILLDNANKYSEGKGNIKLSLENNGKHAVLTVANDSVTLSEEQIAHLFDRFYTVDQSRNKSSGGNGLGLSIAKIITDTFKGKISVASENGRTSFTATLPLYKKKNEKA